MAVPSSEDFHSDLHTDTSRDTADKETTYIVGKMQSYRLLRHVVHIVSYSL
jgi:hypothetical protein